jgi:glyoxylase-like metal-dependent hydrolase (beta-lactamase superfamily II)
VNNKVEVIVQPINLRFSLFNDEIYYIVGGSPEATLDQAEQLMGVGPANRTGLLDCNLGFLPVCSTVLVRGEKNIIIDPNNHHIGFYGMLAKALERRKLALDNIDIVVVSHWHHDHSANLGMFSGGELIVGKNELSSGIEIYGAEDVQAKLKSYRTVTEIDGTYELCAGVKVLYTPGHTPGSISVLVDEGDKITAVLGDSIMTKSEWFSDDAFSHWYTDQQLDGLKKAKELIRAHYPFSIIPGHDRRFTC